MRAENPPLCGRDHLSYRSYYFPVKHVIDGKQVISYLFTGGPHLVRLTALKIFLI